MNHIPMTIHMSQDDILTGLYMGRFQTVTRKTVYIHPLNEETMETSDDQEKNEYRKKVTITLNRIVKIKYTKRTTRIQEVQRK